MPAGFPPHRRASLQRAIRERVLPRYAPLDPERSQSAAARDLKVNPATISRLLSGHGGSLELAERVADLLNEDLDVILGDNPGEQAQRQLRDLPRFEEAMSEAVRRVSEEHIQLSRKELEEAADARIIPEPLRVTAGVLIQIALARRETGGTEKPRAKRK